MKLTGKISESGKLLLPQRDMLTEWLRQRPDKSVELEIRVKRKKRSNPQNMYYWGVIVPAFFEIFTNAGLDIQTNEEAHEILKDRFNRMDICNKDGEVVNITKSTTKNDTFEQEEYHEKCRRWAADFWGVVIQLPNENLEFNF